MFGVMFFHWERRNLLRKILKFQEYYPHGKYDKIVLLLVKIAPGSLSHQLLHCSIMVYINQGL